MRSFPRTFTFLAAGWFSFSGLIHSNAAQAAELRADLNEEIILIPARIDNHDYHLETTIYRPNRTGRFPLIVLNHGTNPLPSGQRQPRQRFMNAAVEFVAQRFAVAAPMRRGYGESDGEKVRLSRDDLTAYGIENALDIKAAIEYLKGQSFVDPSRIIVIGQSTGGLATMAYLSMADSGVLGAVNFHGGMRPKNLESDLLLDARIAAFSFYATTTKLPSLWFYTANDHSSRPEFIVRLHDAYQNSGGQAKLIQPGGFKSDGHGLFQDSDGKAIWLAPVREFIGRILPKS